MVEVHDNEPIPGSDHSHEFICEDCHDHVSKFGDHDDLAVCYVCRYIRTVPRHAGGHQTAVAREARPMTTCTYCLTHWAARTPEQLDNRRTNMAGAPEARLALCPKCAGTEWATTDVLIKEMPATRGRGWFRKVLAKVLA